MTQTETDPAAQALKTLEQHIATLEAKDDTNTELIALMRVQLDEAKAESHRAWMARNKLMRELKLGLGPNSVWTPEEIDAEMRAKGITVVVTPPEPPPPSPFTALAFALDLEPDPITTAARSSLDRWRQAADRHPNMEKLTAGQDVSKVFRADKRLIELKDFRDIKIGVTTEMVMGWLDRDPERPKRVAGWLLDAQEGMSDRSLPLISGGYSKDVQEALNRGADQPGAPRFVTLAHDKRESGQGGDYYPLEQPLSLYTLVLMVFNCWSNRQQGGTVQTAYQEGLDVAIALEARMAYLGTVFYPGVKKRYAYSQPFAHVLHALFMVYRMLYLMTGEKLYSDTADELRGYVRGSWEPVKLPGGLEGIITPHKIPAYMRAIGRPVGGTTWHNSVYLEETCGSMVIDAIIGGEDAAWTFDDIRKLGNLLYWTIPQYGWDGSKTNKIAGNMGGGGVAKGEPRRKAIRFTNGTEIPGSYDLGGQRDGQPDYDEFLSVQRGHTFLPAAWSDIPDYVNKLPLVAKGAKFGRGAIHLAIYLCQLRREGKLPGVVT